MCKRYVQRSHARGKHCLARKVGLARGVAPAAEAARPGRHERGQSLIELALAFPILLILFLGLIEVALAMRAKLVLTNANREAARLASRGTFTDEEVAERALIAFAGQLPVETQGAEANTGIIVTRFHTPPGAAEATYHTPIYVTGTLTYTTGGGEVRTTPSQIDPDAYKDQLQEDNAAYLTANDVVVVETYYHHYQVLNAPLIDQLPQPIILYVRTVMRIALPRTEQ